MTIIYNIARLIMFVVLRVLGLVNSKIRTFLKGRIGLLTTIAKEVDPSKPKAWFHCASLGEFEQGRPVIEAFRRNNPEYQILLTFFSPSGYEVRKNYEGADYIYYLPVDSPRNARLFLDTTKPTVAFFVKYEFWYFYLAGLKKREVPVYSISAIFRPNQVFFKRYGKWYLNLLTYFEHVFVQNEASKALLDKHNIPSTVAGDTRFDRVCELASKAKELPLIKDFVKDSFTIVCGSTWPQDEERLLKFIDNHPLAQGVKFIIAPHEIHPSHIELIESKLTKSHLRYSALSDGAESEGVSVLIIDNMGMLSSIYQYGKLAYIGGGFGVAIHNILEAATWGLPVVFGPNHQKFQEALDLIELKVAFPVSNTDEIIAAFSKLIEQPKELQRAAAIAKEYVQSHKGATELILEHVKF